jgi:hypothetical protein
MTERDEREELRGRQATLHQRTAELQRETERLRGSHDLSAIRALQQQLKHHERELRVFDETLGAFHQRFGPLGQKEKRDED